MKDKMKNTVFSINISGPNIGRKDNRKAEDSPEAPTLEMWPRDAEVSHSAPVLLRENLLLTIRMFANIFSALTSAAAGRGGAGGGAADRAGRAGALQVSYRCGHSVEQRPPEGEQLNNNNSSSSSSSSSESEGAVVSRGEDADCLHATPDRAQDDRRHGGEPQIQPTSS